jgi:hypothetical protein
VTDTKRSGKPPRILEQVPNWLTALAALLTAVVAAASFFAGRATAPSYPNEANPLAQSSSTASASAATAGTPARTQLSSFTVDLPGQYGLIFGASPSRPIATEDGTAAHMKYSDLIYSADAQGKFVTPDPSPPTYQNCVDSTRYTKTIIAPALGTSFCYLGHNMVVSVTLTASWPQYQTLAVVVWAG